MIDILLAASLASAFLAGTVFGAWLAILDIRHEADRAAIERRLANWAG